MSKPRQRSPHPTSPSAKNSGQAASPPPPSPQALEPLPAADDRDAWKSHWAKQDQPWRTEPEIDAQRQAELEQRRAIVPGIKQETYPFKGMNLSRADVEWLLATHENGRGPVNWKDESQRNRKGLDLRGADLRQTNLSRLPLAGLFGGDFTHDQRILATEEYPSIAGVHLEGTNLYEAHLEGANLTNAHLERTNLYRAHLEEADLRLIHLENARLYGTHLEGVTLYRAHLEGSEMDGCFFSVATRLRKSILGNKQVGFVSLAGVHWSDVNLTVIDWAQLPILGDEQRARQRRRGRKKEDQVTCLEEYGEAVRANRQLAMVLQAQGINEDAARFAYRAQALQKTVFYLQILQADISFRRRMQSLGAWFFSWFLFLIAGYGYKVWRSFLAYLLVIGAFMALYVHFDPHLAWYEALVVSMTAFHGRGFSPSTSSPDDPLSITSAIEAFIGLIIEVTFIATLTRRFFGQ